jgi:hypothetical protein
LDSTGDGETVSKDSLFPPKGKDIRNWREVNLAKKILATIIGGKINGHIQHPSTQNNNHRSMVLIEYLDPTAISTKLSFCRRFYRG